MSTGALEITDEVSAGAWIEPRLRGEFGAVGLQLPSDYAAYARICHPPSDAGGNRVRWSQVAEATGRVAHPSMQWHVLVGSSDHLSFEGSLWPGKHPERGNLAPDLLQALCDVLATQTAAAGRCFYGLWEGWGWVDDCDAFTTLSRRAETVASKARPARGRDLGRPRLQLPGRGYVLLSGPLAAAGTLGEPAHRSFPFFPQSPNLLWPADRSWFLASEIDFDSTLVGGGPELIRAILDRPELDAWPIAAEDSLAYDGDRVNPAPAGPGPRIGLV